MFYKPAYTHIAARNTQLWISCTSRKRQNIVKGLKKYSTFTRQIEQQTIGRKFMFPSKLSLPRIWHFCQHPSVFFQFQTFTTPVQGKLVEGKSRRNVSEVDLISTLQDEMLNVHFPDETARPQVDVKYSLGILLLPMFSTSKDIFCATSYIKYSNISI